MWSEDERRKIARTTVSEEQLEELAERAAELGAERALGKFYSDFYREVGKVTVRSVLYICGAALVSLAAWLGLTGKLG